MRTRWKHGHGAAAAAGALTLVAAGFGSALALPGGALGQQVPPPTVTVTVAPPTTITRPPGSTSRTVTLNLPTPPTTTVTTPRATPQPPPPAMPPPAAPPASSGSPASPPPPPPTAPGTPDSSPAGPRDSSASPGGSNDSVERADTSRDGTTPAPDEARRSGTTSTPGRATVDAIQPHPAPVQPRPDRPPVRGAGRPAAVGHVVVGDGDAVRKRPHRLTPRGRSTTRRKPLADIVSLFFPDAVSDGRARSTKRSMPAFPDVQRVLGQRRTVAVRNDGTLGFGQLPLLALSLVLLSSLLLVGALLPPGVVSRAGVSPMRYRRMRQPLALTAVAVLLPLAVGTIVAALS